MDDIRLLDDESLLAKLKALACGERENVAEVVRHLVEVDRRELPEKRAFPSLFVYCVKELGYSEAAAYYRIRAARAVKLLPKVLDMLRDGEIHLESVVRLHPHLEGPGGAALLEAAKGKSTREVEAMAAGFAPRPERADVMRVIAVRREESLEVEAVLELFEPQTPARETAGAAQTPLTPPDAQGHLQCGSQDGGAAAPAESLRVYFSFTADGGLAQLVRRAQELLRHKFPAGRLEDILRDALNALLDKKDPDRRLLGKLPSGSLRLKEQGRHTSDGTHSAPPCAR